MTALRRVLPVPRPLRLGEHPRCPQVDPRPRSDRAARLLGAVFIVAAMAAAALRTSTPVDHGWWLVAYLVLVGGVAQLLLAAGRAVLVARRGFTSPPNSWRWWEVAAWNAGTVGVPLGVLADRAPIVLGGSILLLVALALYTAALHRSSAPAPRSSWAWEAAYYALVVFLATSVCVGAGLAGALPWQ